MNASTHRTVVLAGATGLIGRPLVAAVERSGRHAVVLTRRPDAARQLFSPSVEVARWDGRTVGPEWARHLDGAAGVINLSGASVGTWPWSAARRRQIRASRVDSTAAIVGAIARLEPSRRPGVLVNSSGINYAGHRGDAVVGEHEAPGDSFLAAVARDWEVAALGAAGLGVRVALMRTPLVVGREAPALRVAALPFRLFVGGPVGDGSQWLPWIHLDDCVALYLLALEREELSGAVNVVAPEPRRQREVAAELGRVLHRPARLRLPRAALELVLGHQAELLLDGQRAVPGKALATGYAYRYPALREALEEALAR